jgi:hypothetical protein
MARPVPMARPDQPVLMAYKATPEQRGHKANPVLTVLTVLTVPMEP